jgi:hypothetical protein
MDIPFPDPMTLIGVTGQVTTAMGTPVVGMQVRAFASSTLISTSSMTDANGLYAIRLAPAYADLAAASKANIQIHGDSQVMGAPSVSKDLGVRPNATGSLLVDLHLPALLEPTLYTYHVQGTGQSGVPTSVAGVHCVFTTPDFTDSTSNVTAHFAATADSDENGDVTVALLPATDGNRSYTLTLTTPPGSDFASIASKSLEVAQKYDCSPCVGDTLELALRPAVSGQVLEPDQLLAVPGVEVDAVASTVADVVDSNGQVFQNPVLTDDKGRFVVRLDPNTYDLSFTPPSGANLPRTWISAQEIGASDVDIGPVKLPHAALIRGHVFDSQGGAVQARVALYSVPVENLACPKNAPNAQQDPYCLRQPRRAAEGTTASDGSLQVLLPVAE